MNTTTQVVTVDFHGQPMIAVKNGDEIRVAMKPIAEAIGLDWNGQFQRIKRHPVMATCMFMTHIQMPGDDQRREVATLPLKMLNGWLFGIDANRVKPESRAKLIEYQRECFDVLANYFNAGIAINPRFEYSVNASDTLTKEQQDTLRNLLAESAKQRFPEDTKKQGAFIMRGWSKLKAHFKVGYREIPAAEFTEAVSIAARHALEGDYLPAREAEPLQLNDEDRASAAWKELTKHDMILSFGSNSEKPYPIMYPIPEGSFFIRPDDFAKYIGDPGGRISLSMLPGIIASAANRLAGANRLAA